MVFHRIILYLNPAFCLSETAVNYATRNWNQQHISRSQLNIQGSQQINKKTMAREEEAEMYSAALSGAKKKPRNCVFVS